MVSVPRFAGVVTLGAILLAWLPAIAFQAEPLGPTTTTTLDGACCLSDGGCLDFTESSCASEGGDYQGDGTICDVGVCGQPSVGACCLPDGGCVDFAESSCVGEGIYQGDGTQCDVGVCDVLCGDADTDGEVKAGDALVALKTAVGAAGCIAARCDYDGSGKVTASDALAILKTAVGQSIEPNCPAA